MEPQVLNNYDPTGSDVPEDQIIGLPIDDSVADMPSLLEVFTENDFVELFNPLDNPFRGITGQQVVVAPQETASERIAREKAGVDVRSGGKSDLQIVRQPIVLRSKQAMRLPGHVAKVIGRQLVNKMMQLDGLSGRLADPATRREYELRVIRSNGRINDFLSQQVPTAAEQLGRTITDLNATLPPLPSEPYEQPFPTELIKAPTKAKKS